MPDKDTISIAVKGIPKHHWESFKVRAAQEHRSANSHLLHLISKEARLGDAYRVRECTSFEEHGLIIDHDEFEALTGCPIIPNRNPAFEKLDKQPSVPTTCRIRAKGTEEPSIISDPLLEDPTDAEED